MDLVLQLTPRKSTPVKPKATTIQDDLPNALGLVPKTGAIPTTAVTPKTPEIFRTPSKPPSSGKKTRIKAVQRNLLDEDGFTSPLKIPSYSSPKNVVTPIKLKTSPGKSRYNITPTRKSPKVGSSPRISLKIATNRNSLSPPSTSKNLNDGNIPDNSTVNASSSPSQPCLTISPKKKLSKSPRKIITTPSKITRKATVAPAKLANAFTSPFKIPVQPPVPPSPAKSVVRTSCLLSLSQPFVFFKQKPWDQPDHSE